MPADSVLATVSDALAAVVEAAAPSVVRVEARRRGNASGIAWSAEGLVLASDHTVQRDDNLRVGLPSGDVVEAELLGRDPTTDLALLRTEATLTPPDWAEADVLAVGHLALSVGRHDAAAQTALGIVTRRGGAWRTGTGGEVDAFIETDIGVYPGFSGSALVDARGRFVGLNTSHFGRRASLTLPLATLRSVAAELGAHGRVRRGYLGVVSQPVHLEGAIGLVVLEVSAKSPAEAAGLLIGDVLLGVGETRFKGAHDLVAVLARAGGETLVFQVRRGGTDIQVQVKLAERTA
ncbi:MAG: S1C family serine protease [Bacteroidota bacterium]